MSPSETISDLSKSSHLVSKPHDQEQPNRARFGIRLIRNENFPNFISPSKKKREPVSNIIANAIQISSPDLDDSSGCCQQSQDDTSSIVTIDTTPVEKKVNFDLLQTVDIEPNPSHLLDEETIAACWYNEDERITMKMNRDHTLAFSADAQQWISAMNALTQNVCQALPQAAYGVEDLRAKAKDLLPKYRGLETQAVPKLTSMRRKHMSSVLMHIARIPRKMPEDLRDRMVSARSLQYSRPFTLLALILAQADAADVRE